jgi:cysteine-rich repeat protein
MNNDNCLRSCVLARCGDGYVDLAFPGTEQCDDGNSLSCGTCGEACRQRQVPQPARGSIKAVDRASVRDGEVFAISDGRHRLFFEFNKSGEVPASHEPVNLENANNTSARAVAQAIADAIRKASDRYGSGKLRLWVHLPNGETTISLGAVEPGTHGNQAIIESVDDTDFIVEGMHAGAGYDCRAGTPCLRDEDCSYIDGNGRCMRAANEHLGVCGAR